MADLKNGEIGPVAITGVPKKDSAIPHMRLEIRDMKENYPKHWALYLLGLQRFKEAESEDKPLSYFQIAGIHGLPTQTWPNESWNNAVESGRLDDQYCTHKAYNDKAQLYKHVNAIAEESGDQDFIKAAKEFRMPYWDWALPNDRKIGLFPAELLSETKHQISGPNNKQILLEDNPLASYRFKPTPEMEDKGYYGEIRRVEVEVGGKWSRHEYKERTLRHPESTTANSLTTNDKRLTTRFSSRAQGLYKKGRNLTERTMLVLQGYDTWDTMSTNQTTDEQERNFSGFGGLEEIHNTVHGYIGGGGQMSDPAKAAFDPIFWLHHTNIDRLFTIWKGLHEDKEDGSTYVPEKAFENDKRQEKLDTCLEPFLSSNEKGEFWTSDGVRDTKTFNYTYPESHIDNRYKLWDRLNELYPQASLANMLILHVGQSALTERAASHALLAKCEAVNIETLAKAIQAEQLGQDASQGCKTAFETVKAEAAKLVLPKDRSIENVINAHKPKQPDEDTEEDTKKQLKQYLEWLVDIKASKYSLDGNYQIDIFLGKPDDSDPATYSSNPNHIGMFSSFGQPLDSGCEKCRENHEADMQVSGQIPLTIALVERYLAGLMNDFSTDTVSSYLAENLHWRATNRAGKRIGRADVKNLLVAVVTNEVTLGNEADPIPKYSSVVVPRPDITTKLNSDQPRGKGTGLTSKDL